jgi:hypothetical protein
MLAGSGNASLNKLILMGINFLETGLDPEMLKTLPALLIWQTI